MSALSQYLIGIAEKPAVYSSFKALWEQRSLNSQFQKYVESDPINQDQLSTTSKRLTLARYKPPKLQYFHFLQHLYPIGQKHIHFPSLYQAYSQLPSPRPLFIRAQHFERLLASFREHGGERRGVMTNLVEQVHAEMSEQGIPISISERNNQFYIKYYNQTRVPFIMDSYRNILPRLAKEKQLDISTMNIFLKFAVKFGHSIFVQEILSDIEKFGLRYNRITYSTLLVYLRGRGDIDGAHSLLLNMHEDGKIIDTYIMNILIDIMVKCGEVEQAEYVVSKIISNAPKLNRKQHMTLDDNFKRRNYKDVSLFLDQLNVQPDGCLLYNIEPTYETFSPLLHHFIKLHTFNPQKVIDYLEYMHDQNIKVPTSLLQNFLRVFQNNEVENHELYLPKLLQILKHQNNNGSIKYSDSLLHALIGAFQKQSHFQLKNPNDLYLKWTKLAGEVKQKNWRYIDMKKLNSDAISHFLNEY